MNKTKDKRLANLRPRKPQRWGQKKVRHNWSITPKDWRLIQAIFKLHGIKGVPDLIEGLVDGRWKLVENGLYDPSQAEATAHPEAAPKALLGSD